MKLVFINVFILFTLMFIGFYIGNKGKIKHSSISDFTTLLIDISIPATIIVSMIRPYSKSLMTDTIRVIIILAIYHLSIALISYIVTKIMKVDDKKRGSWIFGMVFSNNGFIGFPLMYAIYGKDGLFIMAMGNIVQNLLIFSLGVELVNMGHDKKDKVSLRQVLFTRQNAAIMIGLILFITQIHVYKPVIEILTYLSNLTAPLSMIIVGLSLSRYDIKNMLRDFEAYRLTVFRMIIVPIIIVVIFKVFGIHANLDLPFAILFYTAVLPSPALLAIFAERYNASKEFASRCVFLTTVLSVITVPIFAAFL